MNKPGARPKVSSGKNSTFRPSRQSKPSPESRKNNSTGADKSKPKERLKKAETSPDHVHGRSYEDGLPSGYWGPNGKSISKGASLTARCDSVSRSVPNDKPPIPKAKERSRSHVRDVADYAEPRTAVTRKTQAHVRQHGDRVSSGSTVKPSLPNDQHPIPKVKEKSTVTQAHAKQHTKSRSPAKNEAKCVVDKKTNNYLYDVYENNVRLRKSEIVDNKYIRSKLIVLLDEVTKLDPKFPLRKTDASLIRTGSYYEKLKVSRPNEFDVMVALDVKPSSFKLEYERSRNKEGYVKLKGISVPSAMQEFMTDDGKYLSPVKIRKHFLRLMKQVTKSEGERKVTVKEHGPAVQLTFSGDIIVEVDVVLCVAFPGEWPYHAIVEKHGLSTHLLEIMKSKGFHVVPKTFESGGENWRVSFSVCEKELLLHHTKCEQKEALKLVKFLREKHERRLPGINSYQLKNIFLQQVLVDKKSLDHWSKDNFTARIIDILSALLNALKKQELCHFFNSQCNLLLNLSPRDHKVSIGTIEWMLTLLFTNDEERIKEMI